MIYKTKYMHDASRCNFSQKNNAIEKLLDSYETCGTTACMSALNSLGYRTNIFDGVQEEDYCTCFLNNENNYKVFRDIRSNLDPRDIPGNRVPQYYPYMVGRLFEADADFFMGNVKSNTIENLKLLNSVQICFDRPGHFVAAVGYDEDMKEVIYNDPLYGFNKRFNENRFGEFRNWGIIYFPP